MFFLKSFTMALFVLIVALMFEKFMQIYVRIIEIFWDEISVVRNSEKKWTILMFGSILSLGRKNFKK